MSFPSSPNDSEISANDTVELSNQHLEDKIRALEEEKARFLNEQKQQFLDAHMRIQKMQSDIAKLQKRQKLFKSKMTKLKSEMESKTSRLETRIAEMEKKFEAKIKVLERHRHDAIYLHSAHEFVARLECSILQTLSHERMNFGNLPDLIRFASSIDEGAASLSELFPGFLGWLSQVKDLVQWMHGEPTQADFDGVEHFLCDEPDVRAFLEMMNQPKYNFRYILYRALYPQELKALKAALKDFVQRDDEVVVKEAKILVRACGWLYKQQE